MIFGHLLVVFCHLFLLCLLLFCLSFQKSFCRYGLRELIKRIRLVSALIFSDDVIAALRYPEIWVPEKQKRNRFDLSVLHSLAKEVADLPIYLLGM